MVFIDVDVRGGFKIVFNFLLLVIIICLFNISILFYVFFILEIGKWYGLLCIILFGIFLEKLGNCFGGFMRVV